MYQIQIVQSLRFYRAAISRIRHRGLPFLQTVRHAFRKWLARALKYFYLQAKHQANRRIPVSSVYLPEKQGSVQKDVGSHNFQEGMNMCRTPCEGFFLARSFFATILEKIQKRAPGLVSSMKVS